MQTSRPTRSKADVPSIATTGLATRILTILAAAILATGVSAATATADGDPASDILLGQRVFYPYSPPLSSALQKTLDAETAAAQRAHFPIKIALIAAPTDLGVALILFDKPQQYASFLDAEISFGTRQPLLVVMPNGYGVKGLPQAAAKAATALPRPAGPQSNDLAVAAIKAVDKLAAAAGHPIKSDGIARGGGKSSSGPSLELLVIVALAAASAAVTIIALRQRQARR